MASLLSTTFNLITLSLLASSLVLANNYNESFCDVVSSSAYSPKGDITPNDKQLLAFPLNLEYLETEFFLFGALGFGLDKVEPSLSGNGPPPKGAQKANLDPVVRDIIFQFGLQEVGHLRAIKETVKEEGFPRPLLDISVENFAKIVDDAVGKKLYPPFNPYANSVNYMLASYTIPYVGLTGYVGGNQNTQSKDAKRLLAGLLGVEAGQDAVIRTWLYERKDTIVEPYGFTIAEATDKLSKLRVKLDDATGVNDEGLVVPKCLGAEQKVEGNILVGDQNSVAFARTPEQVLQVVYGTGDASAPGGFFPEGARGKVAEKFRKAGHM